MEVVLLKDPRVYVLDLDQDVWSHGTSPPCFVSYTNTSISTKGSEGKVIVLDEVE